MYRTQRRRSRFTVTLNGKTEKAVILAYGIDSARDYYTKRGHHVLKVERGDYRVQAQRRKAVTRRVAWWTFDRAAIAAAFEAMTGETLPGRLVLKKGKATTQQRGIFETNHLLGTMEVRVARNLEPEEANRVLWHELAHVAQCLRMGGLDEWHAYCKVANRDGTGYRQRAHEREAREWEALAKTDFLLTTHTTERG